MKAHACLMILAWGFCNPNAIIISRHFKKGWPGRTINNFAYWFQFHIILQSFTLAFVLLALMIIVVHVMGYSNLRDLPFSAHPACGFAIVVLTFSNVGGNSTNRGFSLLLHGFSARQVVVRELLRNMFIRWLEFYPRCLQSRRP